LPRLPERLSGTLVPIQTSGKEEIRISRYRNKKIFLENIKINQDAGPGPKNVGSDRL